MNMAIPTLKPIEVQAPSIYTIHKSKIGTSKDTNFVGALTSLLVSSFNVHSMKISTRSCPLMAHYSLY